MKRYGPQFFLVLLVLVAAFALACGVSQPRLLESVALTPASADAQSYPGGMVPFTATGTYNKSPSPVVPLTATWGACDSTGASTSQVSVSSTGVAHCATGAVGTYTVWAFDVIVAAPGTATCQAFNNCGWGCGRVTGTSLLTCP